MLRLANTKNLQASVKQKVQDDMAFSYQTKQKKNYIH